MNLTKSSLPHKVAILWSLIFFLWGAATIKSFPPVNYNLGDEIWAYESGMSVIGGGAVSYFDPVFYFFLSGLFSMTTGWGVFSVRLLSLISASLLLYLVFRLASMLSDEVTGLFSSLLLGSTFAFHWHARTARPEILTSLIIVLSVYFIYKSFMEEGKKYYLVVSGALVTLSVWIHPNNLQYCLGIVPLYIFAGGRKSLGARGIYFVSGPIAGFFIISLLLYLTSNQSLTALLSHVFSYPYPAVKQDILLLIKESFFNLPKDYWFEYLSMFDSFFPNNISLGFFAYMTAPIIFFSLFTGVRRHVITLFGFLLATSYLNYFVTDLFGYWHVVEFYPFIAICTAIGLKGIEDKIPYVFSFKKFSLRSGAILSLAFLTVFSVAGIYDVVVSQNNVRGYDYDRILNKVSSAVPATGKVLGLDLYRLAFDKDRFVGIGFRIDIPSDCPRFEEYIKQFNVKYIIMDDSFKVFASKACGAPYTNDMLRYLNLNTALHKVIDESYPSFWAPGKMINNIYIFEVP